MKQAHQYSQLSGIGGKTKLLMLCERPAKLGLTWGGGADCTKLNDIGFWSPLTLVLSISGAELDWANRPCEKFGGHPRLMNPVQGAGGKHS